MDYSTISNKTNIIEADETTGELTEKYYLLRKEFDNLTVSYETIKQELHDTKRCYQTALDVQSHLNIELESYQSQENKQKNELNNRLTILQEEISILRQEKTEILDKHVAEINKLESENRRLRDEQITASPPSPERDSGELEETKLALSTAVSELAASKIAIDEALNEINSWRFKAQELSNEIEELKESAKIRKEEMVAVVEREAAAVADLAEMRVLLHQADCQEQQPHAAKGNSIFAEVEDKRQEMAKSLLQMKQSNSRLRRDLANKQAELETLLHEKQTIWEQQAGANAHYDRELIEVFEERISQLEGMCERHRRELCRWFNRVQESEPGWLPAVLNHLMMECEHLRAEVLSRGAAQLASAAQVRELRRKLSQLPATTITSKQSPDSTDFQNINPNRQKVIPLKKSVDDIKKKVSFN